MHEELHDQFELIVEVLLLLAALSIAVLIYNNSIKMNDDISEKAVIKSGIKSEYSLTTNQVVKGTKLKFIQFNNGTKFKASGSVINPDTSKTYIIKKVLNDEVEIEVVKK